MDPEIEKAARDAGYLGDGEQSTEDYDLIVEIGQGISLPEPDAGYRVQIAV